LKDFRDGSEGWNAVTFNNFNKKVRKALKEHVVSRGIYILNANTRSPVFVQLADFFNLKKCLKWPADELAKVAKGPIFGTKGPAFATI
jgi:orotate phosphoribosyltransferase